MEQKAAKFTAHLRNPWAVVPVVVAVLLLALYYLPIGFSEAEVNVCDSGSTGDTAYALVETSQFQMGLMGTNYKDPLYYILMIDLTGTQDRRVRILGPVLPRSLSPVKGSHFPLIPGGLAIRPYGATCVAADDVGIFRLFKEAGSNQVATLKLEMQSSSATWKPTPYESVRERLPGSYLDRVLTNSRRYVLQREIAGSVEDDSDPIDPRPNPQPQPPPPGSKARLFDLRTGQTIADPWLEDVSLNLGGLHSLSGQLQFLTDDLRYFVVMPERGRFSIKNVEFQSDDYCVVFTRGSSAGLPVRIPPEHLFLPLTLEGDLYFAARDKGHLLLVRSDGQKSFKGPKLPSWCNTRRFSSSRIDPGSHRLIFCSGDIVERSLQVFWWDYQTGQSGAETLKLTDYFIRRWNRYRPGTGIPITVEGNPLQR